MADQILAGMTATAQQAQNILADIEALKAHAGANLFSEIVSSGNPHGIPWSHAFTLNHIFTATGESVAITSTPVHDAILAVAFRLSRGSFDWEFSPKLNLRYATSNSAFTPETRSGQFGGPVFWDQMDAMMGQPAQASVGAGSVTSPDKSPFCLMIESLGAAGSAKSLDLYQVTSTTPKKIMQINKAAGTGALTLDFWTAGDTAGWNTNTVYPTGIHGFGLLIGSTTGAGFNAFQANGRYYEKACTQVSTYVWATPAAYQTGSLGHVYSIDGGGTRTEVSKVDITESDPNAGEFTLTADLTGETVYADFNAYVAVS